MLWNLCKGFSNAITYPLFFFFSSSSQFPSCPSSSLIFKAYIKGYMIRTGKLTTRKKKRVGDFPDICALLQSNLSELFHLAFYSCTQQEREGKTK